jgi:hypothetical protein
MFVEVLDVLFCGQKASLVPVTLTSFIEPRDKYLAISDQKKITLFFQLYFFLTFWSLKLWIRIGSGLLEMLDPYPDPDQ